MTWLMEILKICLEEQLLIKDFVIKPLILLKIQNMMDIKADFFQCSITFLIKKTSARHANKFDDSLFEMKISQTKN